MFVCASWMKRASWGKGREARVPRQAISTILSAFLDGANGDSWDESSGQRCVPGLQARGRRRNFLVVWQFSFVFVVYCVGGFRGSVSFACASFPEQTEVCSWLDGIVAGQL